MKHQYRLQEPLAGIAERFAQGKQTLADAVELRKQSLGEHEINWKEKFSTDTERVRILCTDNNSKAALNWQIGKWIRPCEFQEWDTIDTPQRTLEVIEQMEPKQTAWKWMPLICLGNYKGTLVVNGQLCWVVAVVQNADENTMPHRLLVVAAPTLADAHLAVKGKSLQELLNEKIVVAIKPATGKKKTFLEKPCILPHCGP